MTTNFFANQEKAKQKTGQLIILFALAVLAIIGITYLATAAIFSAANVKDFHEMVDVPIDLDDSVPRPRSESRRISKSFSPVDLWNPELFLVVAVGTVGAISIASLMKIAELASGGRAVAEALGGRLIPPTTNDRLERQLLNVVEEMAIAAGVPVPPVYVMDREESINAFAAGFTPNDAVVGVARGTIEYLNRDELQGVIAHEFSHIFNGDMKLNIRLMGILHGILVLSTIGYFLMRIAGNSTSSVQVQRDDNSDRRDGNGGALAFFLLGLVLFILGYVGVFFGQIIKAAVSRQREFLADASAVQFTRNPFGIAGALKKIGGLSLGSRVQNTNAEEASHLFFANALSPFQTLFASHPPLLDRIKAIDPQFDGKFPEPKQLRLLQTSDASAASYSRASEVEAVTSGFADAGSAQQHPTVTLAREAPDNIGDVQPYHVEFASRLRQALPAHIQIALEDPFSARAICFGLLLDVDGDVREVQLGALAKLVDEPTRLLTKKLSEELIRLGKGWSLPIADMAMPALRGLSRKQYDVFQKALDLLVTADGRLSLFEATLQKMIVRNLRPAYYPAQDPPLRYRSTEEIKGPAVEVLSALAYVGGRSSEAIVRAFLAGANKVSLAGVSLLAGSAVNLSVVDKALREIEQASYPVRKSVLEAAVATVTFDNEITIREAELLRLIGDSLHCPIPPWVIEKSMEQMLPAT